MTNAMESIKPDFGNAFQGRAPVSAAWMPIIPNEVAAPILPRITQYFSNQPSVALLISLVATLHSVFISLLVIPAENSDVRFGHKRLPFCTALLYGILGRSSLLFKTLATDRPILRLFREYRRRKL